MILPLITGTVHEGVTIGIPDVAEAEFISVLLLLEQGKDPNASFPGLMFVVDPCQR